MTEDAAPVLQTRGLSMAFGGLAVFHGVDFDLQAGEHHAVIGPNGAGKTTFVSLLTGLLQPTAGTIRLNGRELTGMPVPERVRSGLVRTFQINTLFPALTPLQSLMIALTQRDRLARPSLSPVSRCQPQIEEAMLRLEQFGLSDDADTSTGRLPYGKQRLLEVALSCCLAPRVLLLDEPAAGLSTAQGVALFERLRSLASDIPLLFIEHDMGLVFRYAARITVLAGGRIIAQGEPDSVRRDPEVRRAYLGA